MLRRTNLGDRRELLEFGRFGKWNPAEVDTTDASLERNVLRAVR